MWECSLRIGPVVLPGPAVAGCCTVGRTSRYRRVMLHHAGWHKVRVGLLIAVILVFAGVVMDSLLSASWVLDDGLLLVAAAVIVVVLLLVRGRGRSDAS